MPQIAWFIHSPEDRVKKIGNKNYNVKAKNMNGLLYPTFSMSYDPNPEGDLTCITAFETNVVGVFKDAVTGQEYSLTSVNFVGSRPPSRVS